MLTWQVDTIGGCGGSPDLCMTMLRDYKFVITFDDLFCIHIDLYAHYEIYTLYSALKYSVVPVVYGKDFLPEAPVNSYINARDFNSPKDLADYLHLLNRNDHLYSKYVNWNENYQVDQFPMGIRDGWCSLCEMLHTSQKLAFDIHQLWFEEVRFRIALAIDAGNF